MLIGWEAHTYRAVQLMIFFKTNKMAERQNINTNEIALEETNLLFG